MASRCKACSGEAGLVGRSSVRHGLVLQGRYGTFRLSNVWRAGAGKVWTGRLRIGQLRSGEAWQARRDSVGSGVIWPGCLGLVRQMGLGL